MAQKKREVRTFKLPNTAPDGMVFEDVKRKVGDIKDVVVRVLVPQPNGAGVQAAVKYLTGILPSDGGDGTVFAAEAIRQAIVTSQVTQAGSNGTDISEVGSIVPRIAILKTVNKAEVAGAAITEYLKKNPNPSKDDFNAFVRVTYAGLTL